MGSLRRKWLTAVFLVVVLSGVVAWLVLLWVQGSYDRPNCCVEEGLYIGMAVDRPPSGTRAVVNLCGRQDPYSVEASLWVPVFEGGSEPTLDWLRKVVGFIDEQRKVGRTTYVHCLAGMNRSGAAVTAYLMQEHGWRRDEALRLVQNRRPEVQPNPTLMRLLIEWELVVKEGPGIAPGPGHPAGHEGVP
jgi:Dual specificity phosphatase, catalytic domain